MSDGPRSAASAQNQGGALVEFPLHVVFGQWHVSPDAVERCLVVGVEGLETAIAANERVGGSGLSDAFVRIRGQRGGPFLVGNGHTVAMHGDCLERLDGRLKLAAR